ncbi:MAG: hypothetical protein K8I27_11255 [Planctomycetes bacterium]|nr:hypothetical protein [Planctomycetota bacterium]
MIRAITLAALLQISCPLVAQQLTDAELDALFDKWQAEENLSLEGWRVLDDITLIERLSSRVSISQTEGEFQATGPHKAILLLAVLHQRGIGGAPRNLDMSAKLFRQVDGDMKGYSRALATWEFEVGPGGELRVHSPTWSFFSDAEYTDAGDFAAARALSAMGYLADGGLRRSSKTALSALTLAANAGCRPGMVALARHMYRGAAVPRDTVTAAELLEQAAEVDYMPALMELGRFHDVRTGVRPDLAASRHYFTRAARLGCMGAAEQLNALPIQLLDDLDVPTLYAEYINGWGATKLAWTRGLERILRFEPNPVLARYSNVAQWLRPFADPPDGGTGENPDVAKARCMLGECLLHGVGGAEPDFDEAINLLRSASVEGGLSPALLLSGLHMLGDVKADPEKEAPELILEAVDRGFVPALKLQGFASLKWNDYAFKNLLLLELRLAQPEKTIESVAEKGDVEALRHVLARKPDVKWLRRAADAGIPHGMLDYAAAIAEGEAEGGLHQEAEDLYRRCLGFPETHDAAKLHFQSIASAPSARRALELTRKLEECLNETGDSRRFVADFPYAAGVAQRGFAAGYESGVLYGFCLLEGHGVEAQRAYAVELLLLYEDSPLATYLIGRTHEASDDVRSAIWCYEAAAKADAGYAAHRMGVIYRVGELRTKDDEVATEWFRKGAEADCLAAMVELAKAFNDGSGVPKDFVKAVEWARKAANAGSEDAEKLLDEWNK